MKKDRVQNYATIVLAVAAVIVGGMKLRAGAGIEAEPQPLGRAEVVLNWQDFSSTRNVRGSEAASIVVIEFSDFQCPACAENSRFMEGVLAEYPDVAHSYRHLPLTALHPSAALAARAAECAGEQGRFWEMHDVLYDRQAAIGSDAWRVFAGSAGVPDLPAFESCVESDRLDAIVATDASAARQLAATGTPTMLVNGVLVRGVQRREFFDSLVVQLRRSPGGASVQFPSQTQNQEDR